MMLRNKLFIILFFCLETLHAQQFRGSSSLAPVAETGFYAIDISTDWLPVLKNDLSDLRILDSRGAQVPYIFEKEKPVRQQFQDFPLLQQKKDSIHTILDIDARPGKGTDYLCLLLSNTAVTRTATVSGSHDGSGWYVIAESLELIPVPGAGGKTMVTIRLPYVDYPYIRLKILDRNSDPLPVLGAGKFYVEKEQPSLVRLPEPVVNRKDSNGHTLLKLYQDKNYPVHAVRLKISAPALYKRKISVFSGSGPTRHLLREAGLESGKEETIFLQGNSREEMEIRIENGDNPPLRIDSIILQTRQQTIIALLEKGETYTLAGGNQELGFPEYDLAFFRDRIPAVIPRLVHGAIQEQPAAAIPVAQGVNWLWPALVLMVVLLGFIAFSMVSRIKKG